MKQLLGGCLAMSAVLCSPLVAAEPIPKIAVMVYNYAGVPPATLGQTKAQASRIYRQSGVEIEWLDCPLSPRDAAQFPGCQLRPGPTRLGVRILSRPMAERLHRPADSFGFALFPEDGGFAAVANVFAHRAERISKRHRMRQAVTLGHVVAHELGHLILGAGSHSGSGIMRVPWRQTQIRDMAQGTLCFTRKQEQQMLANVRVRMAAAANERTAGQSNTRSTDP